MADKFLTTKNKKIITTVALAITGWYVMLIGGNPLNLPAQPAIINTPIIMGISLLTVAGAITLISIFMIWTDY